MHGRPPANLMLREDEPKSPRMLQRSDRFRTYRTNTRYAYVSAGRISKLSPVSLGVVGDLQHLRANGGKNVAVTQRYDRSRSWSGRFGPLSVVLSGWPADAWSGATASL